MEKKVISPAGGPPPKGPYSPAIAYGNLVFVSGQGAVDPATGEVKSGDVLEELKLVVQNIRTILEAAGSSMDRILKVNMYLADIGDFQRVNDAYRGYFGPVFPARTTIQAGKLPLGLKVEIEVIAHT
jgi:2-iminobutanoate/2-iminopropanoate deaminase